MSAPRLSVGPIPYLWPRARVEAFYERLAGAAVAVVYLGETVCSKRRELTLEDWLAIGTQFHPELSGNWGLFLLERWLKKAGKAC